MRRSLSPIVDKSSESFYMQIVEKIRTCIQEGQLKEGDPLPSERELAQLFDVSRVPVREALKILAFMGVIEYVKGKGSFVKRLSMSNMLENIDFLLMSPLHTMVDLFEAREAIELQATRLAAQRRSEEDIYAIKAVIAEMESNIKMGIDVYDASMKFHSAIIAASHNTVLVKINEFLADLLSFSRKQSLKNPARHETALSFHKQILQKVIEKDAEGAVASMAEHLAVAKKVICETIQEEAK